MTTNVTGVAENAQIVSALDQPTCEAPRPCTRAAAWRPPRNAEGTGEVEAAAPALWGDVIGDEPDAGHQDQRCNRRRSVASAAS